MMRKSHGLLKLTEKSRRTESICHGCNSITSWFYSAAVLWSLGVFNWGSETTSLRVFLFSRTPAGYYRARGKKRCSPYFGFLFTLTSHWQWWLAPASPFQILVESTSPIEPKPLDAARESRATPATAITLRWLQNPSVPLSVPCFSQDSHCSRAF